MTYPSDTTVLVVLVVSFVAVLACRRDFRKSIIVAAIIALVTWPILLLLVLRESWRDNRIFEEGGAAGLTTPEDESDFDDGVGANIAMLVFGWLPAVQGALCGMICNFIIIRVTRRRSTDSGRGDLAPSDARRGETARSNCSDSSFLYPP